MGGWGQVELSSILDMLCSSCLWYIPVALWVLCWGRSCGWRWSVEKDQRTVVEALGWEKITHREDERQEKQRLTKTRAPTPVDTTHRTPQASKQIYRIVGAAITKSSASESYLRPFGSCGWLSGNLGVDSC